MPRLAACPLPLITANSRRAPAGVQAGPAGPALQGPQGLDPGRCPRHDRAAGESTPHLPETGHSASTRRHPARTGQTRARTGHPPRPSIIRDPRNSAGEPNFCTNPAIITRGIARASANSVLIKLNQIGTVTETLDAIAMARRAGDGIVSRRSGETEDTTSPT